MMACVRGDSLRSKITWRCVDVITLCALTIGLGSSASGHHSTMTSRAGSDNALSAQTWLGVMTPRYFDTQLSFELGAWSSQSPSGLSYGGGDEVDLGEVDLYLFKLTQRFALGSRQRLAVTLPFGQIAQRSATAEAETSRGLGDLSISFQHQLFGANKTERNRSSQRVQVTISAGLITPTGRYASEQLLSVTKLAPQADGALNLNTFNVQTSLGADVWSASLSGYAQWLAHPRLALSGGVGFTQPLTETRDQIFWGADVSIETGAQVQVSRRLSLSLTGRWLKHFADQVQGLDERAGSQSDQSDLSSADPDRLVALKVGGRQQLNVGFSASISITDQVRCDVGGALTPWFEVNTPQLIREAQANLGCQVAWGALLQ